MCLQLRKEGDIMDAQVSNGRKVIFVDGPSANLIKELFGIGTINFHGLYKLLVDFVGRSRVLECAPVITVHPNHMTKDYGIARHLTEARFEMLACSTYLGGDDKALIRLIKAVNPHVVNEIVVLTSDKDFIPVLNAKVSQGIKVYWVASHAVNPRDKSLCLSQAVIQLCAAGVFEFVDLHRYAGLITRTREQHRSGAHNQPANSHEASHTTITVKLNSTRPHAHIELVEEMQKLSTRFVGLTYHIEK